MIDHLSPQPHVSNTRFRQAIKKYFYKDIEPEYTQQIKDLIVGDASETLDTLQELAAALDDDAEFYQTVTTKFDNLTQTVTNNELVTAAALNDLNTRTSTIEEKIPEIDESKEDKIDIVAASGTTLTAEVGKYYRFDAAVGTLAVTLPTPTDTTHLSNVILFLTTGSTPAITFTSNVLYQDGYEIEAETAYEINCLFNGVNWVIAAMKIGGEV